MAEWTLEQALEVLTAGDHLRITHPDYPGEELVVQAYVHNLFLAYRETVLGNALDDPVTAEYGIPVKAMGEPSFVGGFKWGTFAVVGFNWFGSLGDELQARCASQDGPKH